MPNVFDATYIDYAVYEDAKEFYGTAKITLPDITFPTVTMQGAGIAGKVDAPILGQIDAMKMSIDFRTQTEDAIHLLRPGRHSIDLRIARQDEDTVKSQIVVTPIKHIMVVVPINYNGGSVAPASQSDASGEYSVRYWACFVEGKKRFELDPLNYILFIDGVDYTSQVKAALGR